MIPSSRPSSVVGREVQLAKREGGLVDEALDVALLELARVVVGEAVDAQHLVTAVDQALRQV